MIGDYNMQMFIEVFGREIPGYGLFAAIGLTMVILYLRFQKYYEEMDFDAALIALVCAMVGAGIGAKVLYWMTEPESFLIIFNSNIEFIKRLEYAFTSGLVFFGGLIGAGIGIFIFLKTYKNMNALMVLDIFAISIPIIHMFGRMGCFMAGCCYGRETIWPIGITFPQSGLAPHGVKLFPTQLFGVFGNLIIFLILISLSRKNKEPGRLFGLYLIMYSFGRFVIEFFRGDEFRGLYYGFSTSQWLSIPLFGIGLIVILLLPKINVRNKKNML